MTDDDLPDISILKRGDDARVYYNSQRSGNEVDRKGTVSGKFVAEDGTQVVRIHTGNPDQFKQQYVALVETELESGEECVAAYSLTTEADPSVEDPPRINQTYVVEYEVIQRSLLGLANRVMRNGLNVNVVEARTA